MTRLISPTTEAPSTAGKSTTAESSTEESASEQPTSTTTTSAEPNVSIPPNACFFPPGTCDTSSLSLNLYANSVRASEGYAVSGDQTGVGPNYYLDQSSLDQGSTTSLSVPGGDNDDATGDSYTPEEQQGGGPGFQYHPGLTKTYGGMTFNANTFTIVFTGYFVPPTTRSYTFCVEADNRDALYIGSDSTFPFGDASSDTTPSGATPLSDYWFARDSDAKCASVDMVEGFYYPLRSVYGNWGVPTSLTTTVQGPGDSSASAEVSGKVAPDTCSV
ncbi:Topoisomerase I damage affected protein 8 [Fusarium oxysporum f. sp. rapae]|uniref:Topoisomerase I damage affected protein 8 n=1 Tax=Fusarium oxysporum f. sp. rapae TaxID=485398 RepID=A0A8J5PE03_FUSOX|nr:Topoisomerase I damage affected protein 8 [Fusarium oxysporum f. sp. rapae]